MKRKVNRVGTSTLTVSLPSKWAKKYGLKAGDEIEVEEKDHFLSIFTQKPKEIEIKEIKIIPGTVSFIRSIISNAYKKGYGGIKIKFDDSNLISPIREVVNGLLGYEIIEQEKDYCFIKNIAQGIEEEVDSIIKKSFNLTQDIARTVLNDAKLGKFENLMNINQTKETITKFTDFIKRSLIIQYKNKDNLCFYYLVIWLLEKIANQYKYIYHDLSKNPIKLKKETIKFFEETNKLLEIYTEGFYSKNPTKMKELSTLKDKMLFEDIYKLLDKCPNPDASVIHHLSIVVRNLGSMVGPFFGVYF